MFVINTNIKKISGNKIYIGNCLPLNWVSETKSELTCCRLPVQELASSPWMSSPLPEAGSRVQRPARVRRRPRGQQSSDPATSTAGTRSRMLRGLISCPTFHPASATEDCHLHFFMFHDIIQSSLSYLQRCSLKSGVAVVIM